MYAHASRRYDGRHDAPSRESFALLVIDADQTVKMKGSRQGAFFLPRVNSKILELAALNKINMKI